MNKRIECCDCGKTFENIGYRRCPDCMEKKAEEQREKDKAYKHEYYLKYRDKYLDREKVKYEPKRKKTSLPQNKKADPPKAPNSEYISCVRCGALTIRTGRQQQYCPLCSKTVKRERDGTNRKKSSKSELEYKTRPYRCQSIQSIAAAARKAGKTYGQFVFENGLGVG